MTTPTPDPSWACTLPLAPRSHIAGGFRPRPQRPRPLLLPRPACCFCPRPVAPGDPIACETHRAKIDAEPFVAQGQQAEESTVTDRVLIYGSRDWWDTNAIRNLVFSLSPGTVVVHGGARGADKIAGDWAKACGLKVEVHRADWGKHGKAAGPIRNQKMAEAGLTRAYGFRLGDVSTGTDDMTSRLVAAGIPHEVTVR